MKILLVNYRYFISGGPEKYMFNIKNVLEENGHEVIPFSIRSNKNVETEYSRYFVEPIGSRDAVYFDMRTVSDDEIDIISEAMFKIEENILGRKSIWKM